MNAKSILILLALFFCSLGSVHGPVATQGDENCREACSLCTGNRI